MTAIRRNSMVSSVQAEEGTDRLISRVRNRELRMPQIPEAQTGAKTPTDEEDYTDYCRFLRGVNGQKLLKHMDRADAQRAKEVEVPWIRQV